MTRLKQFRMTARLGVRHKGEASCRALQYKRKHWHAICALSGITRFIVLLKSILVKL